MPDPAPFTTPRLGGPARRLVAVTTARACVDAVQAARHRGLI